MSDLRCQYSGVPIHVARPQPGRAYFSCTGCALAHRVPVDAQGNFPINRTLIAVLGVGLVVFNQMLFWLLAVLLAGRNREVPATRFLVASLAVGVAMWLLLVVAQWKATGGGRWTDWLVVVFTGALAGAGVTLASPGCLAASVLLLIAWGLRGLACGKKSA
jgi:hypothetical protein